MLGLLADANAEGILAAILSVCHSIRWRDIWGGLDVRIVRLQDLALEGKTPDDVIWGVCQREGLLLFTDNRNSDRDDSLQATILAHNTPASLPVLTPGDSKRVLKSRIYAERAAIRMMEILMDIDSYRGAGRLFLPAEP